MATKTKGTVSVTTGVPESKKLEQERQLELLNAIAELGGKGMHEDDIVYDGNKLVLPSRFRGDLPSVIEYLQIKDSEQSEISNFGRTYSYRPWDGARNAYNAMKKAFGMVSGKPTYSFFGKNPPAYVQVPVSVTETEEVPWGAFQVPLLEDTTFHFGTASDTELGTLFRITVSSPRKNRDVIQGLFKLIEEELSNHSIYKGKAIDGQESPQFLDIEGFDPSKVVYADHVKADLEAHLWSVIRHRETQKQMGLSLKQSVLLAGPYGTGKSLAGLRTAVEAVNSGWTFLMARPGRDNFTDVMRTARIYQPAVVFMEDVDSIASAENQDFVSELLDLFDGIQAKNTDLIVVLTTNHPEKLVKGMMRPGRLDAIIEINALDEKGIEDLIRNTLGNSLSSDVDFAPIIEQCEGYMPAFVKAVADRAIRYAIARQGGEIGNYQITTQDLVYSAQGLRPQFLRMVDAPEFSQEESVGKSLADLVAKATQRGVSSIAAKAEDSDDSIWNVETLEQVQKTKVAKA